MAPRKPNIRSKKRKFKKNAPPPRLSTAQIRRLTVDGEAVTDAPFVPDVLRSGRFKNIELGMKDMPAGYQDGGKVGKKRVVIGPDSNLTDDELERYIQQLREPLVVKPVKKNKGGGLNAAIERVKRVQGMQEGGRAMSDADRALLGAVLGGAGGRTISDADRQRIGALLGGRVPRKRGMGMKPRGRGSMEGGRTISDLDKVRLATLMGATDRQLMGMEEGGEVPGKRTMEITPEMMEAGRALEKSGKRLEPQRPKNIPLTPEQRKKMKDIKFIRDGMRMIPVMEKEDGGAVPKKFKGFSKLPEDVQQQMNPTLAAKYEDGGVVRGMGRAYRGAPRKVKIR